MNTIPCDSDGCPGLPASSIESAQRRCNCRDVSGGQSHGDSPRMPTCRGIVLSGWRSSVRGGCRRSAGDRQRGSRAILFTPLHPLAMIAHRRSRQTSAMALRESVPQVFTVPPHEAEVLEAAPSTHSTTIKRCTKEGARSPLAGNGGGVARLGAGCDSWRTPFAGGDRRWEPYARDAKQSMWWLPSLAGSRPVGQKVRQRGERSRFVGQHSWLCWQLSWFSAQRRRPLRHARCTSAPASRIITLTSTRRSLLTARRRTGMARRSRA